MIRVAVIGVTGRMGRAIVRAADESNEVDIVAGIASAHSKEAGKDVGELAGVASYGLAVTSDLNAALAACDVAIDFSNAAATTGNLAACRALRKPLVIGTTGFLADVELAIAEAARDIAVLPAPNTSLGVTVLLELVRAAAKALPMEFDIEISEAHHRNKRDAPSGTALALGRAAAEGRGQSLEKVGVFSRSGAESQNPRREGEIGFAVTRGGDIVGEHTVLLAGPGEQVSLGHRATDRSIFARGALKAAAWLAAKTPGQYAMRDVVGYKTDG
ncbi:MAG: 4-hydroxy-tetrahydrodipicolinate reductase [Gammaproteobacteria bacterium]